MVRCVLVHGLTASPRQVEPIRAVLTRHGHEAVAPLLSGHGTRVEDLFGRSWREWYRDVLTACDALPGKVFYVGMSLGALLGLRLAIEQPERLAGLVCIGTPLTLFPWMRAFYPILRSPPLSWCVRTWPKRFDLAVADPVGREIYRQSSYARFPLTSVRELRRLQSLVRANLDRIATPLLLMHSPRDYTAPPEAMALIAARVRGPVRQIWLDRSLHVATLDYDRDCICEAVLEFFGSLR
ncbi:MAG: alpha/beta fold hydrolase [Deltaproteobacteria bacterium]|nr:alpha/beta fold hydrolase [Deltaproteobacteria bacterium]